MAVRLFSIATRVNYRSSPFLDEGEVVLELIFDSDEAEHLDVLFPALLSRSLHDAGSHHDSWSLNEQFPGHVIYTMAPRAVNQFLNVLGAVLPVMGTRLAEVNAQNAAQLKRIEEAVAAAVQSST